MKRRLFLIVLMLSCSWLGGCMGGRLEMIKPGSLSLDQIRSREKPTTEWVNPDGSRTLGYDRRPGTLQNLMLDFDPKGNLLQVREVLTVENFARLRTGMTREEVRRIVGGPVFQDRNFADGGEIWSWPIDAVNAGTGRNCIDVYWHPKVDGAVKIVRSTRFD